METPHICRARVLHVDATRGIVEAIFGWEGSVQIEKLTTSLQFLGAALAVPAGMVGLYSAYHNYFSPEVRCQELRNSTLVTLEKNIPTEAIQRRPSSPSRKLPIAHQVRASMRVNIC